MNGHIMSDKHLTRFLVEEIPNCVLRTPDETEINKREVLSLVSKSAIEGVARVPQKRLAPSSRCSYVNKVGRKAHRPPKFAPQHEHEAFLCEPTWTTTNRTRNAVISRERNSIYIKRLKPGNGLVGYTSLTRLPASRKFYPPEPKPRNELRATRVASKSTSCRVDARLHPPSMTTLVQTRQPLQVLSMSNQPKRRRSERLACTF
jgi:hypothetical protein